MPFRQLIVACITTLLSIVALTAFLHSRGVFGELLPLGPGFDRLVHLYRVELPKHAPVSWFYDAADYVAAGAIYMAQFLDLRLELRPDWKDIISPLMLYFITNATINWRVDQQVIDAREYRGPRDVASLARLQMRTERRVTGRKIFAVGLGLWGLLISLLVAISSGLNQTVHSPLLSLIAVTAWFIVYECGSNLGIALLVGYEGQTWRQTFKHHFIRTQLNIIIGLAWCAIAGLYHLAYAAVTDGLAAVLIAGYVMSLAVRDMGNAWRIARRNSTLINTLKVVGSRSEFKVGTGVFVVFLGVITAIALRI